MPRVKQIDSVQTMADRVLLESILESCNQLCVTGSVAKLREGVAAIRGEIFNRMSPLLLADFANRFLDKIYSNELGESQCQAVLGITMDIDIVGLQLRGEILSHLDPQQAHRFRKLAELHLESFSRSIRSPGKLRLDNFRLNGLVAFVYPEFCTDSDLKIIGKKCPMLEVLKIKYSKYVSDEGLKDLDPCSNLRVVDVGHCSKVSHVGMNHLLSAHKQLEDVSYGYDHDHYDPSYERKLHVLFGLDLTVESPSIRRFVFDNTHGDSAGREEEDVRPMDVLAFVLKFPNLEYLRINCIDTMNLSALRHLTKLTGLAINFVNGVHYDEFEPTWLNIMEVLTEIGARIVTLKLIDNDQGFSWGEEELNFIYNCCPNIEHLEFDYLDGRSVIPAFANLKVLIPRVPLQFESLDIFEDPILEFSTMPNLESLSLLNIKMMLDDLKFPKLSLVKTNTLKTEDLAEIMAIAKANNLEFTVERDPEDNWYADYLAGGSRETDDDTDDTE